MPTGSLPQVVALFNYAKRMQVISHNPFDGLGGGSKGRGRADQNPPNVKQLGMLRDACDVLGDYAAQMRDLMDFAALTLMRPSELYELRHTDVDLAHNRIVVSRRVYRGKVDVPKNGKAKTIALVPPARAILLRQPTRTRDDGLVFVGKLGKQLCAPIMSGYWRLVCARAGLDFDFYLATKHLGVHELYRLGLSRRAIASQAGWSERDVDAMLRIYGHIDLVALAEVDALYEESGMQIGMQSLPQTPVLKGVNQPCPLPQRRLSVAAAPGSLSRSLRDRRTPSRRRERSEGSWIRASERSRYGPQSRPE